MKRAAAFALSLALTMGLCPSFGIAVAEAATNGSSQGMVFKDGLAQQTVSYSNGFDPDYSNEGSDIIRYSVYVETDYDTDLDGKRDLVKAVVQVPRAAAEGAYKAPTIYEARPYSAGEAMMGYEFDTTGSEMDITESAAKPTARKAAEAATTMEAAENARGSEWCYEFDSASTTELDDRQFYTNYTTYDYFLVRGFAIVQSAGLGTWGSEGMEVCGTTLEAEAFKDVVEWLHGDRVAYTDKENNIAIKADWANGKVGMTGRSYSGTMAYEVATTGVEGLETIVPVAGISSWYDYSNVQGTTWIPTWD